MRMGGGRERGEQTTRVQGGVRKKVEGLTRRKEQSQLHVVSLRRTETQEVTPRTGLGGPRGGFAPALVTSRTVVVLLQRGPPELGKEEARGE